MSSDSSPYVHDLAEGKLLASPAVFREYVTDTGMELSWETVQKRFLKLGLHVRTADGLNIHTRTVNGKKVNGLLVR